MIYACLTIAGLALCGNILLFLALVGLHTRFDELQKSLDRNAAKLELVDTVQDQFLGHASDQNKLTRDIVKRIKALENVSIPSNN